MKTNCKMKNLMFLVLISVTCCCASYVHMNDYWYLADDGGCDGIYADYYFEDKVCTSTLDHTTSSPQWTYYTCESGSPERYDCTDSDCQNCNAVQLSSGQCVAVPSVLNIDNDFSVGSYHCASSIPELKTGKIRSIRLMDRLLRVQVLQQRRMLRFGIPNSS